MAHNFTFKAQRFLCLGLALLALLIPGGAIADDVSQFNELTKRAQAARENGDLRMALKALRDAYAIKPLPVLLNNIGKLHELLGEYDLATECYTKVTNDPEAPTDLRVLDQARLAALESKLSRAWVKVTASSRWTDVRVDHVFCPTNGGSEVAVDPGERTIELFDRERREVRLLSITLKAGRRTNLDLNTLGASDPKAALVFTGLEPRPLSVSIDNFTLDTLGEQVDRIFVAPGAHLTRLMTPNGKWTDVKTDSNAGTSVQISTEVGDAWSRLNRQADTRPEARVGKGPKLLTAGLGATLIGSGIFLYYDVETGREYLLDERYTPDISVREAAERWDTLNSRATVGGVLTGLGTAVMVGTALWWWYDEAKTTSTVRITPMPWCGEEHCGVGLGGEL